MPGPQETRQIPNIIEARRLAGQVLERAEKAPIFVEAKSTVQCKDGDLNEVLYSVSTDANVSSPVNQDALQHIQHSSRSTCSNSGTCAGNLRQIQSVVPVLICNGWLDAKDVIRYEMTSKSTSVDANIWKSMFLQHHVEQKMTEHRRELLLQSHDAEMSSMGNFFLGLVTVAMASATILICALIILSKTQDHSTSWENWLGRFGISFGVMTLAEVIALQLIIRCSLGLV